MIYAWLEVITSVIVPMTNVVEQRSVQCKTTLRFDWWNSPTCCRRRR